MGHQVGGWLGRGFVLLSCASMICGTSARAASTVPLTLNGMVFNNNTGQEGWGGHEDFDYNGAVRGPGSIGQYSAFVFDSDNATGGELMNGSGIGWNNLTNNQAPFDQITAFPVLDIKANDFPIFDRAGYGANFNPDLYKLEVVYKPLPTNEAPVLNITMDTYDGFRVEDRYLDPPGNTIPAPGFGQGKRYGEQQQWGFGYADITGNGTTGTGEDERGLTIEEYYDANPKDSDGFVTISAPLTDGNGATSDWWRFSGPTYLFVDGATGFQSANTIPGDQLPDFGDFENLAPNGVVQMHLQSAFIDEDGATENVGRLHLEIKRISVVPINRDPNEIARLDAMSGVGRRFGTPFSTQDAPDGVTPIDNPTNHEGNSYVIRETDQLQRFNQNGFTNLIINTDDDDQTGGFGTWQEPGYQVFDGTTATLEVRAKLTAPLGAGQANRIDVILNDLDGNDLAAGQGGEEYKYFIDLNNFNTTTFTTLSIPLTDFDEQNQAFELVNSGDGSLSNFNLYYLGVLTLQDAGLVDLELEYIRIAVPSDGLAGDYNGNNVVDAADYTVWRDNVGTSNELPNDLIGGMIGTAHYNQWKNNFGMIGGSGGLVTGGIAAPEPSTSLLVFLAMGVTAIIRRRTP